MDSIIIAKNDEKILYQENKLQATWLSAALEIMFEYKVYQLSFAWAFSFKDYDIRDLSIEYFSKSGQIFVLKFVKSYLSYSFILSCPSNFNSGEILDFKNKVTGKYSLDTLKIDLIFSYMEATIIKEKNKKLELENSSLLEKFENNSEDENMNCDDLECKLYNDIIFCCERVQAGYKLKDMKENDINDRIRDLLNAKIYTAKDQTRQGTSSGGKDAGNLDILVEINKQPIALVEALKLDSVQRKYISDHIDKIFRYDTKGYRTNYLIAYVRSRNFSDFVKRYIRFVKNYDYKFEKISCKVDKRKQFPELRVIETVLMRNGIVTRLLHILVHMQN